MPRLRTASVPWGSRRAGTSPRRTPAGGDPSRGARERAQLLRPPAARPQRASRRGRASVQAMLAILDGDRHATPRRRGSPSPTRGSCAATASSRSSASTAAGRSRSTSTSRGSAALGGEPAPADRRRTRVRADVEALLDAQTRSPEAALRVVRHARRAAASAIVEALKHAARDARAGDDRRTRRRACSTAIKSLSYGANMLATRLAQEQGADEALLVTPARARARRRPTCVVLLRRSTARRSSRRRCPSTSSTRSRAGALLDGRRGRRGALIALDELLARRRGVPGLDHARGASGRTRSTAPQLPAAPGPAHAGGGRARPRAHRADLRRSTA